MHISWYEIIKKATIESSYKHKGWPFEMLYLFVQSGPEWRSCSLYFDRKFAEVKLTNREFCSQAHHHTHKLTSSEENVSSWSMLSSSSSSSISFPPPPPSEAPQPEVHPPFVSAGVDAVLPKAVMEPEDGMAVTSKGSFLFLVYRQMARNQSSLSGLERAMNCRTKKAFESTQWISSIHKIDCLHLY